jgi:hypothetical protein
VQAVSVEDGASMEPEVTPEPIALATVKPDRPRLAVA